MAPLQGLFSLVYMGHPPQKTPQALDAFGEYKDNSHIILWMEFLVFFTCFRDTDNARELSLIHILHQ